MRLQKGSYFGHPAHCTFSRSSRTLQVFIKTPIDTDLCLQLDSRTLVQTVRKRVGKQLGIDAAKLKLTVKAFQVCCMFSSTYFSFLMHEGTAFGNNFNLNFRNTGFELSN